MSLKRKGTSDFTRPGDTVNRVFRASFPDFEGSGFRTDAWRFGVAKTPDELKPLHGTLLHAFAAAAKLEDKVGITVLPDREGRPVEHRSYRELYQLARQIAGGLAALGVAKGDRVVLVLPTGVSFIAAFFAIEMVGAIPVPAYPPAALRLEIELDKLGHVTEHSGARFVVTNAMVKRVLVDLAHRAPKLEQIAVVEELEKATASEAKVRMTGSETAFLQYTSGSTGRPKGVVLTHANLVANIHSAGQALNLGRSDVMVSWCPLYHDMGLIGAILFSMYWRMPVVLMSPLAFLSKPVRWLKAISDYKGTISPSPNFGYGLCVKKIKAEEVAGLDLSSWRLALNGAEPVNLRTLIDFQRTFQNIGFKKEAFLPVYGLAEVTLSAAFPRPGQPIKHEVVDRAQLGNGYAVLSSGKGSTAIVSVGSAVPGQRLLVVDEKGRPVAERQVGHVIIGGKSVMSGYFNDPESTHAVLRDGWLWTGDLGYVANQQLYITGRAKDLIILHGRNHYAEDLERSVERVKGVRPGGCVAFGVYDDEAASDKVVVVCETALDDAKGKQELSAAILASIAEHNNVRVDEVVLVEPGTIPKTSSGKRQRSQCRDQYLKNELRQRKTTRLGAAVDLLTLKAKSIFRPRRPTRPN